MPFPAEVSLKDRVVRLLTEEIAPALQLDPKGIDVCGVSEGVVQVRLGSVCAGCPGTIMAIVMGLEQELRRLVPEVECLEVLPG